MNRKITYLLIVIAIAFNLPTFAQNNLKDSLIKAVQINKLDSPTVSAYLNLGSYYRKAQDSTLSADNSYKALALAKKIDFKRGIALSYIELGYLYELTDDLPKAKLYYNNAIQYTKRNQIKKELALAYSYMFFIYSARSEFNNAVLYADSSLKIFEQLGRKKDIANQLNNIGTSYWKLHKNVEAIKYLQKTLDVLDDIGTDVEFNKLNTYLNIGLVFEDLKSHDQALKYFNKVVPLAKKYNAAKSLNDAYNNIGNVYLNTKKYKQALYYYQLNLPLALKSNETLAIAIAYANLSVTYTNLKDYKKAEEYLKISTAKYQSINNVEGIIANLINSAQLLSETKRLKEADEALNKAMTLAKKNNFSVMIQNIYESMAEVSKLKGDFNDAYAKQDSAYKLQDKNFNFETNKQIADLEVKYKTADKEKQIAQNKTAIALGNIELQRKNNWLLLSGFSILFLVTGTGLIIRNSKLKQNKLKSEAAYQLKLATVETTNQIQEEKLRISRELHDNIGSQLTFISNSIESFEAENGAAVKLNEAQTITKNTIRELRRTVWLINQPEFSLEEFVIKLRDYVKPFETGKPIINIIAADAPDCVLKPITATNLFRIIQEGVNNSLKYADASLLEIILNHQNNNLNVLITDNGKGFDLDKNSEGYGLKNIKARVETLKGECIFNSKPAEGTKISINLPI